MIKEAIKYLTGLGIKPTERYIQLAGEQGDRDFIINDNGEAREIKPVVNRAIDTLQIHTLTGLISYVKSNKERFENEWILQIYDEGTVFLKGLLDSEGEREHLVTVKAITPAFDYEYFHDVEELIIALQSKFVKNDDRDLVLKVIGNVKEENVRTTGDTGISQAVTIKTGVASSDDVLVPNPVTLAPYRTFLEVEQPESDFIFRMKDGPRGAIFEADGGAWRNEAIDRVRDYLAIELTEEIEAGKITIIA